MRLCFEFVLKTMLITQGSFVAAEQCLHTVKAFSTPCTTPPASRLGVHKWLGGDTGRTADPNWPKGCPVPYDIMHSNKPWGKKKGGTFGVMFFLSSQVTAMCGGALLSWKWLNTRLLMWSSEQISYFTMLASTAFALPVKLSLSQPTGVEWMSGWGGLSCWLGLSHNRAAPWWCFLWSQQANEEEMS